MGIDVEFKVRPDPPLTPVEFEEIRRRFMQDHPDSDARGADDHWPTMRWDPCQPAPTIEVSSLDRLYSPYYARGHWPQIRALGDWLTANIPGEIRYGGDTSDTWEGLTPWPEARATCEAFWTQHGNEPYYSRSAR